MPNDVLLLRGPSPADALGFLLEEEGVEPAYFPLLEVAPPTDTRAARAAVEHVGRYQWVLPDAPSAVRAFAEAAFAAGTLRQASSCAFIAPDHDTARVLGQHEWMPRILLPPLNPIDAVVETLRTVIQENDEVLVLIAEGAERPWAGLLRDVGARVAEAPMWRETPTPPLPDGAKVVVVHSPAAAEAFVRTVPAERFSTSRFVAVGPTTAHALKHLGVTVWATADRLTTEAALDATLRALSE